MLRFFSFLAVMLFSFASSPFAQEATSDKATIQAGYGTVTIGDTQWQRFSFRPDIPIGPVGIGLDLELFLDNTGKISKEGWDFSNRNQTIDTILRKIYYVRYGKPQDPVYLRVGALDAVTLGYGLIMDGYRNTLNYPGDKKLGVVFGLENVGTFGLGIQGMVNSLGDFKNKGAVVGGRVSARPFKPSGFPLFDRMTIGATFVRDVNQYAGLKDSDNDGYPDFEDGFPNDSKLWLDTDHDGLTDYTRAAPGDTAFVDPDADGNNLTDYWWTDGTNKGFNHPKRAVLINVKNDRNGVSVYGFDAGIPLLEGPLHLDLYGQYAKIYSGGWGIAVPGFQATAGGFRGRIEYRHFAGRFRPNYFDNLYENVRVALIGGQIFTKLMTLPDVTLNGVYGLARYNFSNFFSAQATYQTMSGGKKYQDLTGKVEILNGILSHIPKISVAEAYFYNTYVDSEHKVIDITANTLYGTRIGIALSPSLSIVWDTRYTFTPKDPTGTTGFVRHRFVGIETVMAMR
ncbi:MAG: hypothetical protein Q8O92_03080 [Candidatus Latescibacter sp.]|nr:hypothetical protein [Candidatus Latescibacter sp.]